MRNQDITPEELGRNQDITPEELLQIHELDDFDLTMILSEIHDHGWPIARRTLQMVVEANHSDHQKGAT